jgi:hypothetical protein
MKNEICDDHDARRSPAPDATACTRRRPVSLAIVHHANQFVISDGYENRPGIRAIVGSTRERQGLAHILGLHRAYGVPANLNVSGTLLECLAWYEPAFLRFVREMYRDGLLELVGSAYGQNVMRFFSYRYNLEQLGEALRLYRLHLGVDPREVGSFWPPERVWDARAMAAVATDPALPNGGYKYVFVDDRLLLSSKGTESPRQIYDGRLNWDPQLFHAYRIERGHGLIALPLSTHLRRAIPPRNQRHQRDVAMQLSWLSSLDPVAHPGDFLAVYGDDMEKPAGVGWDAGGPEQFEEFLRWVSGTSWITPTRVSDWAGRARIAGARPVEGGTYLELASTFDAGELYENWYFDPRWTPYREYFAWSQERVRHLASLGADSALMALAEKHLLASGWETAWHTTAEGAHGVAGADGGPSSWARAVASHSRHAAVIAEAAFWQRHKDDESHAYVCDVDNDGEEELILKNDRIFAVVSPRRGGRLVALFAVDGAGGAMVIGNPSDDWHFKEELNDYMDVPPNHPGALADVGFEHDAYSVEVLVADGLAVSARLRNVQSGSAAFGLEKTIYVSAYTDDTLRVDYEVPSGLSQLEIEFALSPDYLQLLRCGSSILSAYHRPGAHGFMTFTAAVWVQPEFCAKYAWGTPYKEDPGHGRTLRLRFEEARFGVSIGVERSASLRLRRTAEMLLIHARPTLPAPDPAAAEQGVTG